MRSAAGSYRHHEHGEQRRLGGRWGWDRGLKYRRQLTGSSRRHGKLTLLHFCHLERKKGYALGNPFRGVKAWDGFVVSLR